MAITQNNAVTNEQNVISTADFSALALWAANQTDTKLAENREVLTAAIAHYRPGVDFANLHAVAQTRKTVIEYEIAKRGGIPRPQVRCTPWTFILLKPESLWTLTDYAAPQPEFLLASVRARNGTGPTLPDMTTTTETPEPNNSLVMSDIQSLTITNDAPPTAETRVASLQAVRSNGSRSFEGHASPYQLYRNADSDPSSLPPFSCHIEALRAPNRPLGSTSQAQHGSTQLTNMSGSSSSSLYRVRQDLKFAVQKAHAGNYKYLHDMIISLGRCGAGTTQWEYAKSASMIRRYKIDLLTDVRTKDGTLEYRVRWHPYPPTGLRPEPRWIIEELLIRESLRNPGANGLESSLSN